MMQEFITGEWSHIFDSRKGEVLTRILINTDSQLLGAAQVQRDRAIADSFTTATREEMKDLQDSLVNANGEIFDNPSDHGLLICDDEHLPEWVSQTW